MLIIQRNPYHLLYPSWQMYLFLLCHWNEYSLKLAYIHLPLAQQGATPCVSLHWIFLRHLISTYFMIIY